MQRRANIRLPWAVMPGRGFHFSVDDDEDEEELAVEEMLEDRVEVLCIRAGRDCAEVRGVAAESDMLRTLGGALAGCCARTASTSISSAWSRSSAAAPLRLFPEPRLG